MPVLHVRIDELLEKRGLTRYRLAEEAKESSNLSQAAVYAIVRGEFRPRLETLAVIMSIIEKLSGQPVAISDVLEYDKFGESPKPKSRQGMRMANRTPSSE